MRKQKYILSLVILVGFFFWTFLSSALARSITIRDTPIYLSGFAVQGGILDIHGMGLTGNVIDFAGGGFERGNVPQINFNQGGSRLFDDSQLRIQTDDFLYLNAPQTVFVQNTLQVSGPAKFLGGTTLSAGDIATADLANDAVSDAKVVNTLTASNYLPLSGGTVTMISIGGGTTITKHLSATASIDFASIALQLCGTRTITATGAAAGDTVIATPLPTSGGIETLNLTWSAWVSTADTVTVRACNPTLGALDPVLQTWRVDVWQH